MFTIEQYAGKWIESPDWTPKVQANAEILILKVQELLAYAKAAGIKFPINPVTGSIISGTSLGGFRPQNCEVGAKRSAHKTGEAVDIYDPSKKFGEWCLKNQEFGQALQLSGLYAEHPAAISGWVHLTTRAPRSGKRVFYP